MKNIKIFYILSLLPLVWLSACKLNDLENVNQPTPDQFSKNASVAQLNTLVTGSISQMRANYDLYIDDLGVLGRESYRFSGSDPRYTSDLPGANGAPLDNNAFYTTNPYASRYATVKTLNILINAVNNTNIPADTAKQAYLGVAKTLKAHELLMVLNMQHENGIRIDVNDPEKLGPFLSREESFAAIAAMLDEGAQHLTTAGTRFPFLLPSSFADFNSPSTFRQFNRGLAARVAVYRSRFDEALTLLTQSFLDLNGNYTKGVYLNYSAGSGDRLNTLYLAPNATGDIRLAQPSWVAEAEATDKRLSKVLQRTTPATSAGLTGTHDIYLYRSNTDPTPVITNEELVLIYAEAQIQAGTPAEGALALNKIRTNAGLLPYAGPSDKESLITEMLKQRRYSLFMQGHRWIDMRRYNRLNQLPVDRAGDIVHTQFPRPFPEVGVQGG
ncbi:RagB/SusD family nutrient uptake outer membrane protein [Rhodocytophaga rosea]|uniref:RagB/SusD family nutrient uptake outer membrane protein n=1 Tax=Rhodocytophaga rosea TaxID=2704465 RepID=A0A6C0GUT6_9BACT|nr:RagB/SusD family nutrient uptake outer membrane protein [Rhodocytophaga rosea]QHT71100.1 RagB/SusD family nutrient uptake outer membrane protein [Rhodocytophaga rosea]